MKVQRIYQRLWFMLPLCCLLACSSDDEQIGGNAKQDTPLQIELMPVPTRSVINGTTLPDGSQYGVYVTTGWPNMPITDGNNVAVDYRGDKSTPSHDVLLDERECPVYAYYPYSAEQSLNKMTLEVESQTDYLYGIAVREDGSKDFISKYKPMARIRMSHALALLRFNIFNVGEENQSNVISSIILYENPVKCTLDLTNNKLSNFEYGNNEVNCRLTVTSAVQTVDILAIPSQKQYLGLCIMLNGNPKYIDRTLDLQPGYCYSFNVMVEGSDKLTISDHYITPRENNTMPTLNLNADVLSIGGTIGTPVDLGLSVKWADHNLGADSPEKYGGRYLWGDPTGSMTTSDYVTPSLSNISNTQYDIAKAQWGGSWRLPTEAEIKELVDNTTFQWTTRNGAEGGLFTSKKAGYTNKSIFIPWFGARWTASKKMCSNVWSGTKSTSGSYARDLTFDEDGAYTNYGSSFTTNIPVRPVCN